MKSIHPGHCKVCGSPVNEVKKQFPVGHKLAGRPIGWGKPMSGTVVANLLLVNGVWASLRLHEKCAKKLLPDDLPSLWAECLRAARFDDDNRELLGSSPLEKKQREAQDKNFARLAQNVPLGICCYG